MAIPMVAFVHDEIVLEVPVADAEQAGQILAATIEAAGRHFKLRVPLAAHVSIGPDWSVKS
jgi:DNA polymerase I-like protein with 3'-5' exonuclease and polymerase domains